jgi:hypothetical protein
MGGLIVTFILFAKQPLCKRTNESIVRLLVHCRYTHTLWGLLKVGLASTSLIFNKDTWGVVVHRSSFPNWKVIASLVLLACWEVWNERNDKSFSKQTYAANGSSSKYQEWIKIMGGHGRVWVYCFRQSNPACNYSLQYFATLAIL